MSYSLGDYAAEFKRGRGKDKGPRKRRSVNAGVAQGLTLAGVLAPAEIGRRIAIERDPGVMAIKRSRKESVRRAYTRTSMNLAARTKMAPEDISTLAKVSSARKNAQIGRALRTARATAMATGRPQRAFAYGMLAGMTGSAGAYQFIKRKAKEQRAMDLESRRKRR